MPLRHSVLQRNAFHLASEGQVDNSRQQITDVVRLHVVRHIFICLIFEVSANTHWPAALEGHRYLFTQIIPSSSLQQTTICEINRAAGNKRVSSKKVALLFAGVGYVRLVSLALSGELRSRTIENLIGPEETGGSKIVALAFWLLMLDRVQQLSDTSCVESSC